MLDVAPVLDPARRAFESMTSGGTMPSGMRRDARAAAREALEAARELRRAAHEMRRAVERFPRGPGRLPAASDALTEAARAVREATKASREATRQGIGSTDVLSRATSHASKSASKQAARAARESQRASRRALGSVMDVRSLMDLGSLATPVSRVGASLRPGRRQAKRRTPSLVQLALLVIVPVLLVTPLVLLLARRRNGGWSGEADDVSRGSNAAISEPDPEVADDLLRSEGEGFSTGIAAPTMGAAAATAEGGPRSEGGEPSTGEETSTGEAFPPTVVVPDATDPDRVVSEP